jgi:hypothetical protein
MTPIFSIQNPLGFNNLGEIFQSILTLAFFVAGLGFFAMLISGGIQWITAGGDPKSLQAARARITNAVIGFVIVVAAYAIAVIASQVFGISIVNGFKFK